MTEKQPRNIVLISLDDAVSFWKYKTIFGEALQTPNLDRICAQSTGFHSAYCQTPLCGPSRASFMSGKTPHQLEIFENKVSVFDRVAPEDMWPYRLKENGYFCSSGGKVHHGYRPLAQPIHEVLYSDERKGFRIDRSLRPDIEQRRYGGHAGGLATTNPKDDGYYHDAHSSESFIDFVEGFDGESPFYREVGFFGPHGPFITPAPYKDMYTLRNFRMPEEWQDGYDVNDFAAENMGENFDLSKPLRWRKSVRNYFSAFSHVDHHLGRVWDALKASPYADNTVVVILSDHGFHLGDKNRFRKTSLWEQVARVPLIIHDPQQPVAREVHTPVALIDVGPTVMDYTGLPPLADCVGQSLRPLVDGAPAPDRAVPTFHFGSAGIRKGDYRFIRYEDGSTQLFDVQQDWWQLRNLGETHPAYPDMQQAHRDCCRIYGFDPG
ncbi:sulfatase-like hydrolase/transferase [Tropicibacter oceani]|uniref:Sulfatase-like hydrolase/transferase n=1 Tax=Tropicibacter oceani TaxID=3058420 RepID=A0ABY8QCH0_9RHOB|nr:sulfatase-like hydrolase/transferase [Tropicibacter oceani]WGW02314.1 sulfatase-like hydrolase/transferase [Tropicibacter oceani]